ncbi:MAG TPA: DUF1573 domain-containing protein, partial [Phycisphaerae bacterium]|nr:DUF1573 domain-containing protein [Phycisphaerae bacterium]
MRSARLVREGGVLVSIMSLLAVVAFCSLTVLAAGPSGSASDAGVTVDPAKVPVAGPGPAAPQPEQRPTPPVYRPTPPRPPAAPVSPPASQPVLTGPPPTVKIDELTYDFGKQVGIESVSHTFKLKNLGPGTLTIEGVQPQCGCTTAGAWEKTVAPGAEWQLPITLRTAGSEGRLTKFITVRTNDPKMREFRYTITGEVKSRYAFKPMRHFQLGRVSRDKETRSVITVTNQTETPIVFKKASVDSKFFQVALRELSPGKEYEITLVTVPPLNEGFTQGKVTIETDCREQPTVEMFVYAMVPPRLTLTPLVVMVPNPLEEDARRSVTLRNEGETPVHVKQVLVGNPAIQSEVTPTEEGKLYQIWLTVPKGTVIPPTGLTVTILTDDEKMPTFTAQIRSYAIRPPMTRPAVGLPTTRPAVRLPTTRPAVSAQSLRHPGA